MSATFPNYQMYLASPKYSVFQNFLSVLDLADYHYEHWVVRCADYRVPQSRSRLVLLASKLGDIELVPPTHAKGEFVTVRDTIQDLDEIEAGNTSESDPLHKSSGLAPIATNAPSQ